MDWIYRERIQTVRRERERSTNKPQLAKPAQENTVPVAGDIDTISNRDAFLSVKPIHPVTFLVGLRLQRTFIAIPVRK